MKFFFKMARLATCAIRCPPVLYVPDIMKHKQMEQTGMHIASWSIY